MKKVLGVLAFLIIINLNLFAETETNFLKNTPDLTNNTKAKEVEKIDIDEYYSMNLVLGLASSPITEGDLYLTSGLEINFYKYYGTKNYGTNLKIAFQSEDKQYGSYKITPGLVYRFNLKDDLELFTGVGASFSYYNKMNNTIDSVNLFYLGIDGELGFRYYPIKGNHKISFVGGLDGGHMWNVAIGSNRGEPTRYQVNGFLGFSYIFTNK